MLNVQIAESIISLISFLFAYVISVTIAGYFTAWVVLKMGDETPLEEGFLTLNPLAHIDILGTLFLILYNFGWGRFIPINPSNITGELRIFKIIFAFMAKTVAHLMIAITSLVLLIGLFGPRVLMQFITHAYPESSSYLIAIGLILTSMLLINMILAVISFFINMCGMVITQVLERYPEYMIYQSIIMILIPLALYYLFGPLLFSFTFMLIEKIGYSFATVLHLM